mmetsp:Transcript_53116/g.123800  ORF Transcript_53116/g.123800 Transcript_53116/m.123800 type:complete len:229 (-) Transcript_53116:699-1385(-)
MLEVKRVFYIPGLGIAGDADLAAQDELVHTLASLAQANANSILGPIELLTVETEEAQQELGRTALVLRRPQRLHLLMKLRLPGVIHTPLAVGDHHGGRDHALEVLYDLHRLQVIERQQHIRVAVQAAVRAADHVEAFRPIFHQLPQHGDAVVAAAVAVQELRVSDAKIVLHAEVHLNPAARVRVCELDKWRLRLKYLRDVLVASLLQAARDLCESSNQTSIFHISSVR